MDPNTEKALHLAEQSLDAADALGAGWQRAMQRENKLYHERRRLLWVWWILMVAYVVALVL